MCDTDMILQFRQSFDTVKSIWKRGFLKNFADTYIFSTTYDFDNFFLPKQALLLLG